MARSLVFMFPGQGSQYYQMGRELFIRNRTFREWMLLLDEIVRGILGESVIEKVYDEKKRLHEKFDRLLYAQPAIFMVEYALAQTLLERGIKPDYVLGMSMGEFSSAALAGVMNVEGALECLLKQAVAVERRCGKGGMLAIIRDVFFYRETPLLHENSELAGVNYSGHFVVSAKADKLAGIERSLRERKVLYQSLPVAHAFHSSDMDSAASEFKAYLSGKSYQLPGLPFVSCVSGSSLPAVPGTYFWDIVRKPMRFSKAIRTLEQQSHHVYLDLGPGGSLANFAKRNFRTDSASKCYSLMTPFDRDAGNLEHVAALVAEQR